MSVETFGITMTYDPSTQQLTPSISSLTVNENDSAEITVSLVLIAGAQGSVVFHNPPITWSQSTGAPSGVTIDPPQGGTSQITINDPNTSAGRFDFNAHVLHTPLTGNTVLISGDPTIINEGTGQS
jgi:hypothetical protein